MKQSNKFESETNTLMSQTDIALHYTYVRLLYMYIEKICSILLQQKIRVLMVKSQHKDVR